MPTCGKHAKTMAASTLLLAMLSAGCTSGPFFRHRQQAQVPPFAQQAAYNVPANGAMPRPSQLSAAQPNGPPSTGAYSQSYIQSIARPQSCGSFG